MQLIPAENQRGSVVFPLFSKLTSSSREFRCPRTALRSTYRHGRSPAVPEIAGDQIQVCNSSRLGRYLAGRMLWRSMWFPHRRRRTSRGWRCRHRRRHREVGSDPAKEPRDQGEIHANDPQRGEHPRGSEAAHQTTSVITNGGPRPFLRRSLRVSMTLR